MSWLSKINTFILWCSIQANLQLKVCYLIESMGAGGKERQLFYLIRYLSRCQDYSIKLIILSEEVFYLSQDRLDIDVVVIEKSKRYSLKSIYLIFNQLRFFGPSVIHFWCETGPLLCLPYTLLNKNVKKVYSIRYGGLVRRKMLSKLVHIYNMKSANLIISNSRSGLEVNNLSSNQKSQVIHNGIDQNCQEKSENNSISSPPYLQFVFRIVMVASFTEAKDQSTLVRATAKLIDAGTNLAVVFVGEGSSLAKVKTLVSEQNKGHYFFLGKRKDVSSILSQMHIGILLSNTNGHAEGLSNAIMEYMAQGLPVIATNAGGNKEIVKDEINGFLIPDGDFTLLARRINYLLQNPEVAEFMGKTNKNKILKEFSTERMVKLYKTAYNKLIEKI